MLPEGTRQSGCGGLTDRDADDKRQAAEVIGLDRGDLRREPLDTRRATLALLLKQAAPGLRLNERACCSGMRTPSDCEHCRSAGTRNPARARWAATLRL